MPDKETMQRVRRDKAQGKAPSTQAGEFVREEIDHIREGKHGARSTKQAIAIGLSKARRAGVALKPPEKGKTSERTRRSAKRAYAEGRRATTHAPSPKRSRATRKALKREGRAAASRGALAKQAKSAASRRTSKERSQSAHRAVRTEGPERRAAAARRAARSRRTGRSRSAKAG